MKSSKIFENHENYNCKIELEDNSEFFIYANWLHNNNLDNWKNWKCEAGATRIYIDKNLNVWSGECKNDFLGNIDSGWNLFESHSICEQDTCTGCTDDLLIKKWKN